MSQQCAQVAKKATSILACVRNSMEMALGNTVPELDTGFDANFQAAWQNLEQLCEGTLRGNRSAEKEKHWDSERAKVAKTNKSLEMTTSERQEGSPKSDSSKKIKEKGISGSLKSTQRKRSRMSFEEYLNYDQPQKKKIKKVAKASVSAGEEEQWHSAHLLCQPSVTSSCSSHPRPSLKRSHEERAEQEPAEAPEPKRLLLNVDIKLPEIPLPPIQASSSPLPAAESLPCSQKKRRAVYSAAEEPEGGFTGRRIYSKTPVFSGLKTSRVPRAPSQHSALVTNNTGSICEAGGVSVVEPALGRCPTEQLCGPEERHPVLTGDTEGLWQKRCLQEFKNEEPKAAESWREMYLRLHQAREQRLLKLAQKITSAQANKDGAAKAVLLDSPPRAPRDVLRRQQQFGTGGALLTDKTQTKPVPRSSTKYHPGVSQKSFEGPRTSCDPRRPPVKKIAPMMAQSLKDFKNMFSRR